MGYTSFDTGISKSANITLSGSNLTATENANSSTVSGATAANFKLTGKWYFETKIVTTSNTSTLGLGIRVAGSDYSNLDSNAVLGAIYARTSDIDINTSDKGVRFTIDATNDYIQVAVDLDNSKIWFRKNGTGNWNGTVGDDPGTNVGGYDISGFTPGAGVYPCVLLNKSNAATFNFGASAFQYTVPTGFAGWSDSDDNTVGIDCDSWATAQASNANISLSLPGTNGADRIVVVAVQSNVTSGSVNPVNAISGGSLTWHKHKAFTYTGTSGSNRCSVEIWWAYAASALGATTITISWSGTYDDAAAGCFAVSGANTTAPFDANAAIPATNSNTASSSPSVTGLTTTGTHGIELGVTGDDTGPTGSGGPTQPSGFTKIFNKVNGGGSKWALINANAKGFTAALSSASITTTGSFTDWGMIGTAIVAASPAVTGTWASTEAKDTFAGAGGILGGSWASTEAKDTFAGAGYPQLKGTWASTEARDAFAGAGGILGGSWHSTEAPDIFAGVSVQITGTFNTTEAKDIFAGTGVPCPIGSLIVTEAKDTFAAAGYPRLRGTMAVTDAKDVFAGTGAPLLSGSWASTEAKDHFAGTGVVPSIGTMTAIEAKDVFDGAGAPPATFGLDAHATGGGHDTTSATVSITSIFNNDIIVLGILSGGFWNRSKVSSITDTAGLTWHKRNRQSLLGVNPDIEIWWAKKPLAGATTITVHTAATTGFLCIDALAIKGANYDKPWDTHTGAGWITDNFGTGNPIGSLYSNSSTNMGIAFYGSNDGPSTGDVGHIQIGGFDPPTNNPGWTWLERKSEPENVGQTGVLESAYGFFNSQLTPKQVQFGGGFGSHNVLLAQDVIVSADDPYIHTVTTDDAIRWHFDGHGQQTIVAMAGSDNSATLSFQTYEANTVAILAVMIQSALGARVDHITDDGGHTWLRRSIATDGASALSLEVWWCQFAAAFNGNVTVVADSNISSGDIIGFIANGINGPDSFLRGEIWDGDASLPHTHGSTTASYQTDGPFSTLNENVLEVNFVANTGTDPSGFNQPPWLQFTGNFFGSPSGKLVSQAPDFNIALDFKFNQFPADNETVELDVSPKPQHWIMIADALPVGEPSPPVGSWHSTEAKDKTGNSGAFTAIGLNTLGWVGYVPATATMAATDAKDRATNSGAFTAIWNTNGWIGYIPLEYSIALTDAKDVALMRAWVLGPTTILARWESTEDRDRIATGYLFTSYTTPDSVGDRTSRITVTTNASLGGGTPDRLVDGNKANGAGNAIYVNNSQSQAMYFRFDFGSPRLITEAKWYQNGTSAQPGLWKWQGSANGTTWTDLSATFTLNAGNGGAVIGDLSANITRYQYYRILQTTNAGGNDIPWLWEIEFKAEGIGGTMAVTEYKDRANYQVLVLPIAQPIPARKRRLLIVT